MTPRRRIEPWLYEARGILRGEGAYADVDLDTRRTMVKALAIAAGRADDYAEAWFSGKFYAWILGDAFKAGMILTSPALLSDEQQALAERIIHSDMQRTRRNRCNSNKT